MLLVAFACVGMLQAVPTKQVDPDHTVAEVPSDAMLESTIKTAEATLNKAAPAPAPDASVTKHAAQVGLKLDKKYIRDIGGGYPQSAKSAKSAKCQDPPSQETTLLYHIFLGFVGAGYGYIDRWFLFVFALVPWVLACILHSIARGLDSKEECCQASNDKPEAAPLVGTQTKEAPPPEDPPEDTAEDEKQKSNAALLARIEETKKKTQDAANHTASSDSGSGAGSGTGSGSGAGSGSGSSGNPDRNIGAGVVRGMAFVLWLWCLGFWIWGMVQICNNDLKFGESNGDDCNWSWSCSDGCLLKADL
jgi:hypothetical protein